MDKPQLALREIPIRILKITIQHVKNRVDEIESMSLSIIAVVREGIEPNHFKFFRLAP